MAYKNLLEFVLRLEQAGELIRVKEFVDPVLEISEITDRFSKQPNGGKAILFENTGTSFPVLMNAFGSDKRMCMALGVDSLDEIGAEISNLFKSLASPKKGALDKMKMLPLLGKVSNWMPTTVSGKGACQEVVMTEPNLGLIPILKTWPNDGGPFVTLPMVNTVDPHSGIRNVGMYRMQVFDSCSTGMHWHKHKVGARHYAEYKKMGKPMPVSVTLGGDPAYTYSATAPLPDNIDEYMLAGFLRKKKVKLVKCLTNDLYVPDDVDFVIEGYVDTSEDLVWEGPFGDHTGFYSLADWYPKFHVTCITHKRGAIYPATIVGVPPMEDAYIAKATERIFLEPIKLTLLPEVQDMFMPTEGVAHNLVIAKIQKDYPGHASKVMNGLWGAGQMMFNKILVAVNGDVDVHDVPQVVKALWDNVSVKSDVFITRGILDVLDHSSGTIGLGGKIFIDATQKVEGEYGYNASVTLDGAALKTKMSDYPDFVASIDFSLVDKGYGFVVATIKQSKESDFLQKLASWVDGLDMDYLKFLLVVDSTLTLGDWSTILWYAMNNADPSRDAIISSNGTLLVNGCRKRVTDPKNPKIWPNVVTMDAKTISIIDAKWDRLGLGNFIESPSIHISRLKVGEGADVVD